MVNVILKDDNDKVVAIKEAIWISIKDGVLSYQTKDHLIHNITTNYEIVIVPVINIES